MRFVDTNVLLYAVSTDPREAKKSRTALDLLDATDLALSVQVLQEFFVQATRVSRVDRLSHAQAGALVEAFLRFPVQDTSLAVMRDAIAICERHRLSYWGAAILAEARALGCEVRTLRSQPLFLGKTVLLETEWVLRCSYKLSREQIGDALGKLIRYSRMEVEDLAAVTQALVWHSQGMDLADALHLAASRRADWLATFDRKLAAKEEALRCLPRVQLLAP